MNLRASIYAQIWVYKDRRKRYRQVYGLHSEKYRKMSAGISQSLGDCRKRIKRLDKLKQKNHLMKVVDKALNAFMGISVEGSGNVPGQDMQMAKRLFYRYCMEQGITGTHAARFCNAYRSQPSDYRMAFIRSFKDHPENRETWHRFTTFMESYNEVARKVSLNVPKATQLSFGTATQGLRALL